MNHKNLDAIYKVIDELGLPLDKNPEEKLIGGKCKIDSIQLLSLVVAVEQELGVQLMTEAAMSATKSPFRTIGTLAEFANAQAG